MTDNATQELDNILAKIKDRYGTKKIIKASEVKEPERIPIGDIQLDWATSGGIPLGRFSHFYGPPSSGKSLISLKVIANAQKMGLKCAYYDVEKTFLPGWAERFGVDVDNLIYFDDTLIEKIGEKMEFLMKEGVNVHVVDSIAAAVSIDQMKDTIEKWHYALSARAWNKVLPRLQAEMNPEHSVILLNHVRTDISTGRLKPTGGWALQHDAAVELSLEKKGWLFKDKKGLLVDDDRGIKTNSPTKDTTPAGLEFFCRVAKSKVNFPLKSARMRLDYDLGDFDQYWSLAMFAEYFNVVQRGGSWYTLENGTKVQGENGLRQAIAEDDNLRKKIEEAVLGLSDE